MKKGWKIFWIVCAICFAAGFVCLAVSFVMGVTVEAIQDRFPHGIRLASGVGIFVTDDDWDEGKDVAVMEENQRQTFAGVNEIDADIWAGEVEIRMASEDSDEIVVETENIDRRIKFKCYMDGSTLKLRTKKRVLGIKNGGGTIYIYIPRNYSMEDISMEIGAGYLHAENAKAHKFSVEVGAGEAVIDQFTAQKAEFECGAGSVTAAGEAAEKIDIECGIGSVTYTAPGRENDYNYKIDCGIGEVNCGSSSYSGIGAERKIDNGADTDMSIECGIGEIVIQFSGNSGQHHVEHHVE